ncbi:glycosyltransferase family 4 protein [Lactiplantibacillus paraplantarum]|uniref:glycosyltransferase family 4 protein n=1 Tax=Lactiplantibacillus paraplantarum TaxID=60520 RepID=UPI0023AA57C4|nr:glycosyltransferase family 4 protein [Lactiplantibacillus paraplantarum]WEE36995.1 glycosyltransferase family 4 protein [Lactiplantibacillus paraplantarum]
MNIGIFTDTYYPQVSGVATSIKVLRNQLERAGHQVYIFTTTDPHVDKNIYERNIFRFTSIPFVSFTDRRIAVRGLFKAYQVAKDLGLDIVHTQTEFSMGMIGKFVAKQLKVPCIHTYHTMYEDYLHYIANGKLLKPYHVKEATRAYCYHLNGIVAPSERVAKTLTGYGVKAPIRIIPTGIDINQYEQQSTADYRQKLGYQPETPVLLSLSRLAYEKNIHEVIAALPAILAQVPTAQLLIVGDGPARETLENQVQDAGLMAHVQFTGEIDNDEVYNYYQMADLFVSASNSESQGLTYIEALAAGLKTVVASSPYTDQLLDDPSLGTTFTSEASLVKDVVRYLQHPNTFNDPKPRQKKLYQISAEYFGKQVINYYQDVQLAYSESTDKSANISN